MDEKKNAWGRSIGRASGNAKDLTVNVGTMYYYGSDGKRAVCDARREGDITVIINGAATTLNDGKEVARLYREQEIDLLSGWSPRP